MQIPHTEPRHAANASPTGTPAAEKSGRLLILRNDCFEQHWSFRNGQANLEEFLSDAGRWHFEDPDGDRVRAEADEFSFGTRFTKLHPCQEEALEVSVSLEQGAVAFRFVVFAGINGSIVTALEGDRTSDAPAETCGGEQGREKRFETLGPLRLHRLHCEVEAVEFGEITDLNSDMTHARVWQLHASTHRVAAGSNFLSITDPSTGEGLFFLLLGASRVVRASWSAEVDFEITRRSLTQGYATQLQIRPGSYPIAVCSFAGGRGGRRERLHALQRKMHVHDSSRDGLLLSNTWGDRGTGGNLGEAFLAAEVAAGKELGVEVVQIDDGWQKGITINTTHDGSGIWRDFWKDPEFWNPHPERFPNGLEPTLDAIAKAGMQPGLWYAPDSSNEFANWERDAAILLGYWRRCGVCHFKMDGMSIESRLGEERVLALLDKLHRETGGAILFDMDTTAQLRLAFWGHMSGSTIFLENRYTDHGNYHPHQTLRAIWHLSHFVWPTRLRMEFLNPARKDARYGNDPLRPSFYPPQTLFAITIPTSPLAWMELSALDASFISAVAPLIAVWKQHRHAWCTGDVAPIGEAPNGYSWTGFVVSEENSGAAQVLVFRENNASSHGRFVLPCRFPEGVRIETLGGDGTATVTGGDLSVEIPEPFGFLWFRLPPKNK